MNMLLYLYFWKKNYCHGSAEVFIYAFFECMLCGSITVNIWKPDIRILEPFDFPKYLCSVFEGLLAPYLWSAFLNGPLT